MKPEDGWEELRKRGGRFYTIAVTLNKIRHFSVGGKNL